MMYPAHDQGGALLLSVMEVGKEIPFFVFTHAHLRKSGVKQINTLEEYNQTMEENHKKFLQRMEELVAEYKQEN